MLLNKGAQQLEERDYYNMPMTWALVAVALSYTPLANLMASTFINIKKCLDFIVM